MQTSTRPAAQRYDVVSIAIRAGMLVPNAAFTAGTMASGIGRVVSSVPTRWQNAAGVSAWACTAINQATAMVAALFPDRIDDPAVLAHDHCQAIWVRAHV